ncbi:MAG: TniQ family protein [Mycolicibacterium sp.]|nr:TniQ family protein [Mycolicibacterium sp.]
MVIRRRLPLRVEPLPGEAIDSWLEVTARRMELPLGAVARALDLSTATRPIWIGWLSLDQLGVIEAATGVSSSVVEAMTLSVYNGTALQLDPDSHRLDATFPFGALSWSRFCPECIRESDGRWQLEWRLGWSFACLLHNCLLADRCSNCGKCQRRQQVYRRVPSPSLCGCGYSLCATRTVKLTCGSRDR